jgi:general secretion pathway protein A
MYLKHYGFRDKPFKLTHDPAYYYGDAHQVPLNELCYSIEERHGLAILLGEAGTGKTTLMLRLLRSFANHLSGVFLSDIAVGEASLIRQVARALLIPFKPQDATDTVSQYLDIFLRGQVTAGKTIVVLVDEAQGLTDGQFEELRYLTNLEHKGKKLVEIVLAGLPSLERKFQTPDFESLSQRAVVRCWAEPLDIENTEAYIHHRLDVVSAPNPQMFSGEALERVHHASRGIPRLINIVCERTLLIGYVEEEQVLKASHVDQAVADLNLKPIGDGLEQHTGAFGIEGNLLLRMTGQLDEIMKKLAKLEAAQAASDAMRSGSGDAPRIRQWLKSLRQNPLKAPRPNDVPDGEAFDEVVDTAAVAQSAARTHKTETSH